MKKWLRFFFLSFFSQREARGGVKRGYGNVFLSFLLALTFLFSGLVAGEMLPFDVHYASSPDFSATAHRVFANADGDKRIAAEIADGDLRLKKAGGEYTAALLINTFENELDRQSYSVGGYNVVVDSRPAGTLADFEAYCLSNDGKNTEITYEEYLTLSEVARLNFDFKLRYTGNELVLTDDKVAEYLAYAKSVGEESRAQAESLTEKLSSGNITEAEYNRAIYELYFVNYYPQITAYESTSAVPLLRNYYYHQYISQGADKYLFIFDDYMTGSFVTEGGVDVQFYGFYSNIQGGAVVSEGASESEARGMTDRFIKSSFGANLFLTVYSHLLNILSLAPFIALMLMVAALLAYSVLRLLGVESVSSLGAMLKVVGSFAWFSGVVAAVCAVIISFLADRSIITALILVLFFVALLIRSAVFIIIENKQHKLQSEQKAKEAEV